LAPIQTGGSGAVRLIGFNTKIVTLTRRDFGTLDGMTVIISAAFAVCPEVQAVYRLVSWDSLDCLLFWP
jgi:hypothetical protein